MERQAFSRNGIERAIRTSDFQNVPKANQDVHRENLILSSLVAARTKFSAPANPLAKFDLLGNSVFKLDKQCDQLVERKIAWNLKISSRVRPTGRSSVVENLKLLLEEGVAFRVYRLDVRRFYESFDKQNVSQEIDKILNLSPQTKILIKTLLDRHKSLGGKGIPRGLPMSAVLAEIMMVPFDRFLFNAAEVFFYSRYVDDIIIITSGNEGAKDFISFVKKSLPTGLNLNPKKFDVSEKIAKVTEIPNKSPKSVVSCFEYLGYKFTVSDPHKKLKNNANRVVEVDIAKKKIQKYKNRLSKSFLDYSKNKNWELLRDRVKYLSNNFGVFNTHLGKKKLAGIYHSYPIVDVDAKSLHSLDHFLRGLVLTNRGRIGTVVAILLTAKMKRELLTNCFTTGHAKKSFVYFSATRISDIQKCWKY